MHTFNFRSPIDLAARVVPLGSGLGFRRNARFLGAALVVGGLFLANVASADEYADVSRLVRAGQMNEAGAIADKFLASKPRDAQMRFLKGVIQTEQGKANDAINSFVKLTEDFPELPEPYNNLAVLYAQQTQFDKARAALEMAIRTNPSYATAHENLGDVYAKLASQAYSKALQLDANNAGVQPKLNLIRDLFSPGKGRALAAAPVPVPAQKPVAAAPVPAAPAAASPPAPVAVAPSVAAAPIAGAPKPGQAEVEAAIKEWAAAWSARDVKRYLAAYGKDFSPASSQSKIDWEAERKTRILSKNKIAVALSDMIVSINGTKATARFKQSYKADALSVSSRKTLELAKAGDRWVIVREISGD